MSPEQQTQFNAITSKYGYKPPTQTESSDWFTATAPKPTYPTRVANTMEKGAEMTGQAFARGAEKLTGDANQFKTDVQGKPVHEQALHALTLLSHAAGTVAGTTVGAAVGAGKAALAPVSQIAPTSDNTTVGEMGAKAVAPVAEHFAESLSANVEAMKQKNPKIALYLEQNPDVAKSLVDLANVAGLTGAGKVLGAEVKGAGEVAATVKSDFLQGLENVQKAVPKASPELKAGELTPLQDRTIKSLQSDYEQYARATKSGNKYIEKVDKKVQALNRAGTTGKPPEQWLAERKIIPNHEGTKIKSQAQADEIRANLRPLNDALTDAVNEARYFVEPTPIDELLSAAERRINSLNFPLGDKKALINDTRSEFELLREKYGDDIAIDQMQNEKPAYWGGTKFDSTKPFKGDSYYQVGKSLQAGIESSAEKAGLTSVAQLNREVGDGLESAKFLEKLDGQTLKYGRLGKYLFMGIGASLGHSLIGKAAGVIGGEMVGQLLIDAQVSSPVKRLILASIKQRDPAAYQETLQWLSSQDKLRELRLKLPAPAPLGSDKNPIIPPAGRHFPTTYENQADEVFSTKSNKTGDLYRRNLKTGEMKITPKED